MDPSDREAAPQFSQPFRQIAMMLIVLGLTGFGAFVALPRVLPVFEANPYLNGFILFVFVIGVLACFWQVAQLITSVRWIENFAAADGRSMATAPQLLAPLATLLRSRGKRMQIGQTATRSILDSVATRIDEAREITRYIVNMLIFLGLLGTFYGLATTVPAVVDTIRSLEPREGEAGVEVFNRLMSGLESQLGGMGVAFASSLLGLAGSLVVGLLELFAGHGQNRFYRELEEWLSSFTRVGFSSGDADGSPEGHALAGVMEAMSQQMDALQQMVTQTDVGRSMATDRLGDLAQSIESLSVRLEANAPTNDALSRLAESQQALVHVLSDREEDQGIDAESRMRLRSIDVQLLRILEEIAAGRQETMAELRSDMRALRTALAEVAQSQSDPVTIRPPRKRGQGT